MQKALVLGYGESGRSAELFLKRRGWSVVVADCQSGGEVFSDTDLSVLDGVELVVASPGVPPTQDLYREAVVRGIPVIGEVELALRFLTNRAVGITGTNGKTTVTLLTAYALERCGLRAVAAGNVGTPLTLAVDSEPADTIFVIELSSWQLETVKSKVLDAAVVLNITPDHLDRHLTMDSYASAKAKIQEIVKEGGVLYVHPDVAREFSTFFRTGYQVYGQDGNGANHHDENRQAAFSLCRCFGISEVQFYQAIKGFQAPPHRLELIGVYRGVRYVDDSKGTNVDAVVKAVGSTEGSIFLIAGGVDKQCGYGPWLDCFPGRVRGVFAIGQARDAIRSSLQSVLPVMLCESLEEAVKCAAALAQEGDTVLLSPGCASYDMFNSYKHRGLVFRELVHQLSE